MSKKNGRWTVELNPDIAPRLRINADYAGYIKRADNSADNTFLRTTCRRRAGFSRACTAATRP